MEHTITISEGRFAADDAALAARRAALKAKLLSGDKISLKPGTGNAVQGGGSDSTISIPKGKLAADDAALKAKREALKKKLMGGEKITLKGDGNVTGTNSAQDATISIPKGKLAAQWYESNPTLLEAEKAAMTKYFPNFKLGKLDDGRLYWMGELAPGVYETKFGRKKSYYVKAVYQNNHPNQQIEPSIFVYIIYPEVHDLERDLGGSIPFVMKDSYGDFYFRIWEPNVVQTGHCVTTATSVLCRITALLCAYELVLTGDLDYQTFLNRL